MIGLRRPALPLLVLAIAATPVVAQVQDAFQRGSDALLQGRYDEALQAFQDVLAQDPSNEDAYELWQSTNQEVWLRMLAREGEMELVGKRLMELARMGRKARENDPDAIRALLADLDSDDVAVRTRIVRQLAADHGEYAVALMVYALADQAKDDRRVLTMQALTHMGSDVVPPLIAALASPDAYLRRNVALTLGYVGDARANASLAALAASDADQSVQSAATQALQRCGGSPDAVAQHLAQGDAYYAESDSVLMPHQYSDVVWEWSGNGLASIDVPRFLYATEMAKRNYYAALAASPGSQRALAGIARCVVTQRELVDEWTSLGEDAGDWSERIGADELAVQLAGAAALDVALGWALEGRDQIAATGLCRALAGAASAATSNLGAALGAGHSAAVRGEAAVALGTIAFENRGTVDAATVAALTEAAAREVLQIVAVIDGNDARRGALARALADNGISVNAWGTGARGLAALRAVSGVDAVLVADRLPDLTLHQVVAEVRRDPRLANTPLIVIATQADDGSDFGEGVTGVISGAQDLAAVHEALSGGLDRDRAQAADLAARAAGTIWRLAMVGGTDLSAAADALALAAGRSDAVAGPAVGALGVMGGASHVAAVASVVADADRPDEIRVGAARALGGIFSRIGSSDEATVAALHAVASKDASQAVRAAAAGALGRLNLSDATRAELISGLRSE